MPALAGEGPQEIAHAGVKFNAGGGLDGEISCRNDRLLWENDDRHRPAKAEIAFFFAFLNFGSGCAGVNDAADIGRADLKKQILSNVGSGHHGDATFVLKEVTQTP